MLGTVSGKLIHHKQVWFSNKNSVLFNGAGSAVSSITWRCDIVVWSDLNLIRVMNIATQTAICYINCPHGVGFQNPFPCTLFWESDRDLLISWADNIRHIQFISSNKFDQREITVRTALDIQMDCITCGVAPFDKNHLIVYGCIPPSEDNEDFILSCHPEVKIITRMTGEVVSCDVLPMLGQNLQGPWDYHFISSYLCPSKCKHSKHWQMDDYHSTLPDPSIIIESDDANVLNESFRSNTSNVIHQKFNNFGYEKKRGNRGFSPILFFVSPEDIVIAKVRDVNDRIGIALHQGNFAHAANLALMDKLSLRQYQFHDVITLYIEDLLKRANDIFLQETNESSVKESTSTSTQEVSRIKSNTAYEYATLECIRLIGKDPILWERWIYAFIKKQLLVHILPYIPVDDPLLPKEVYEVVLETFFLHDSRLFLSLVELWGRLKPPIFSHEGLLARLESAPELDSFCMEAVALLYLWLKKYEKALDCYLEINYNSSMNSLSPISPISPKTLISGFSNNTSFEINPMKYLQRSTPKLSTREKDLNRKVEENSNFIHVFELIEQECLYDIIKEKVVNLMRLSKELSVSLLMRNIDKIPIAHVVRQLKAVDKYLLHYYLNYMFRKYDMYNNDKTYSEYHIMQVSLYAEFSPKTNNQLENNKSFKSISKSITSETNDIALEDNFAELIGSRKKNQLAESDFMYFLRTSKFYPLDFALRECEKAKPPLYQEMVYIFDLKGLRREALSLLLRQIGDITAAVDFIERHEDIHQPELWNDLVDYSLQNQAYLSELLDYLGVCNLDAVSVVSSIPSNATIPFLRQKFLRIIKQYNFQVFVTDQCNKILEDDVVESSRRLKQGQRRAVKVCFFMYS